MPTTDDQLSALTKQPGHIIFDDVFLATNALSPTPVEEGGSLVLENEHCALFTGELENIKILVQVLKKVRIYIRACMLISILRLLYGLHDTATVAHLARVSYQHISDDD